MEEQEKFKMYAINVDAPYIVEEKDVAAFLENSKQQEELSAQIGNLFGEDAFHFVLDENGNMAVNIHGNQCD